MTSVLLMALPSTPTDGCLSALTSVYAGTSRDSSSWPMSHDRHQTHFWTGQRCLASSPSLRPHHTTHWPHCKTATSSEHFCGQPPPYGYRNCQFPGTTVSIYRDASAGRRRPYVPAPLRLQVFQSVHVICRTWAPKQRQSWPHNASYGRACGRIATPGHVLVSPASTPKSPVTR
jgi:hypothetical protein